MARPLRIEFPGAFYHVMNRGNTCMNIYRSERDREKFLEYVGEAVKRFEIKVHTYCLMTPHYHFQIETPHPNLSQAIKWINFKQGIEQQGDPPTENPETPPNLSACNAQAGARCPYSSGFRRIRLRDGKASRGKGKRGI